MEAGNRTAEEKAEDYTKKEWPYWSDSIQYQNAKGDYLNGYNDASQQCEALQSENENLRTALDALDKVRVIKSARIKELEEALRLIDYKLAHLTYLTPGDIQEILNKALHSKESKQN